MDEPFGAVDEITRGQLQDELLRIHRQRGITVVFVTHDIAEAVKLGTRMLVMDAGRVQQCAEPAEILRAPATPFVEQLVRKERQLLPAAAGRGGQTRLKKDKARPGGTRFHRGAFRLL